MRTFLILLLLGVLEVTSSTSKRDFLVRHLQRTPTTLNNRTLKDSTYTNTTCTIPSDINLLGALADASGRRTFDAGNMDVCTSNVFSGDPGTYCLLQLGGDGGVPIGMCIPPSCGVVDFDNGYAPLWDMAILFAPVIEEIELEFGNELPIAVTCGDGHVDIQDWSTGAKVTIACLSILVGLVLVATIYHTVVLGDSSSRQQTKSKSKSKTKNKKTGGDTPNEEEQEENLWHILARSCSLTTSFKSLTALPYRGERANQTTGKSTLSSSSPINTDSFDGVRSLSAQLVVLGHTVFFDLGSPGFLNQDTILSNILSTVAGQVFPSAEFSVDTFFLLSGCLGAYVMVKKLRKLLPSSSSSETDSNNSNTASSSSCCCGQRQRRRTTLSERLLVTTEESDTAVHIVPSASSSLNNGQGATLKNHTLHHDDKNAVMMSGNDDKKTSSSGRSCWSPHTIVSLGVSWVVVLFQRWMRLVPAVGVMMLLVYYILPLVGSGPLWYRIVSFTCSTPWYNLFFVNNYFPDAYSGNFGEECVGWTWYLAVDFQLHACLPILIFVYLAHRLAGWISLISVSLLCLGVTLSEIITQKLSAMIDINSANENLGLGGDYSDYYYAKPYARAPAFLVGVGLAFCMLEASGTVSASVTTTGKQRIEEEDDDESESEEESQTHSSIWTRFAAKYSHKKDLFALFGMMFALALLGYLFYIPMQHYAGLASSEGVGWSKNTVMAYTLLGRPLWSVGVAIMLYICCIGKGGFLHSFLSAPVWVPLSRLTFSVYLVHPIILYFFYYQMTMVEHWSAEWIITNYIRNLVCTHFLALFLYLFVEAPFAALQGLGSKYVWNAITMSGKRKVSKST